MTNFTQRFFFSICLCQIEKRKKKLITFVALWILGFGNKQLPNFCLKPQSPWTQHFFRLVIPKRHCLNLKREHQPSHERCLFLSRWNLNLLLSATADKRRPTGCFRQKWRSVNQNSLRLAPQWQTPWGVLSDSVWVAFSRLGGVDLSAICLRRDNNQQGKAEHRGLPKRQLIFGRVRTTRSGHTRAD